MHNLHLMVVPAEDGQEACSTVECEIEDWGDENNWRHISGAVSQDNEVYENDGDGRFSPKEEGLTTIEKINEQVRHWVRNEGFLDAGGEQLVKRHLKGEELKGWEWYKVRKWADRMAELADLREFNKIPPKDFNVLEHNFYEYKYDNCGVTQSNFDRTNQKLWVVFIDMHS